MAIVLSGTSNDITINNVSVATDTEVSTAVALAVPVGTIVTTATTTALVGTLKCNGALISRTTYSALFAAIGTTFGVGDGSTSFKLPDLRGEFIRGWDDGRGIDPGRVFGSAQADLFKAHTHTEDRLSQNPWSGGAYGSGGGTSVAYQTVNTGSTGGVETRPRNIAMLYCIKY